MQRGAPGDELHHCGQSGHSAGYGKQRGVKPASIAGTEDGRAAGGTCAKLGDQCTVPVARVAPVDYSARTPVRTVFIAGGSGT